MYHFTYRFLLTVSQWQGYAYTDDHQSYDQNYPPIFFKPLNDIVKIIYRENVSYLIQQIIRVDSNTPVVVEENTTDYTVILDSLRDKFL